MAQTPWQRRIRRAEHLAGQHSFAAEILGFYVHLARFQETLYQKLEEIPGDADSGDTSGFNFSGAAFPRFLSLVEANAPAALAQLAHEMHTSDRNSWPELFSQVWANTDSPTHPAEFLLLAFLQPYAEISRSQHSSAQNSATRLCPNCGRRPVLAILRPQGDGGSRSLLCGFCMTEWEFRRIVCPGCGQENHAKLPVYTAESFPYIRVECCDSCQTYIKSIDLTKNGLAEPMVDEMACIPLDLWAQEHGYLKLHSNLLGM